MTDCVVVYRQRPVRPSRRQPIQDVSLKTAGNPLYGGQQNRTLQKRKSAHLVNSTDYPITETSAVPVDKHWIVADNESPFDVAVADPVNILADIVPDTTMFNTVIDRAPVATTMNHPGTTVKISNTSLSNISTNSMANNSVLTYSTLPTNISLTYNVTTSNSSATDNLLNRHVPYKASTKTSISSNNNSATGNQTSNAPPEDIYVTNSRSANGSYEANNAASTNNSATNNASVINIKVNSNISKTTSVADNGVSDILVDTPIVGFSVSKAFTEDINPSSTYGYNGSENTSRDVIVNTTKIYTHIMTDNNTNISGDVSNSGMDSIYNETEWRYENSSYLDSNLTDYYDWDITYRNDMNYTLDSLTTVEMPTMPQYTSKSLTDKYNSDVTVNITTTPVSTISPRESSTILSISDLTNTSTQMSAMSPVQQSSGSKTTNQIQKITTNTSNTFTLLDRPSVNLTTSDSLIKSETTIFNQKHTTRTETSTSNSLMVTTPSVDIENTSMHSEQIKQHVSTEQKVIINRTANDPSTNIKLSNINSGDEATTLNSTQVHEYHSNYTATNETQYMTSDGPYIFYNMTEWPFENVSYPENNTTEYYEWLEINGTYTTPIYDTVETTGMSTSSSVDLTANWPVWNDLPVTTQAMPQTDTITEYTNITPKTPPFEVTFNKPTYSSQSTQMSPLTKETTTINIKNVTSQTTPDVSIHQNTSNITTDAPLIDEPRTLPPPPPPHVQYVTLNDTETATWTNTPTTVDEMGNVVTETKNTNTKTLETTTSNNEYETVTSMHGVNGSVLLNISNEIVTIRNVLPTTNAEVYTTPTVSYIEMSDNKTMHTVTENTLLSVNDTYDNMNITYPTYDGLYDGILNATTDATVNFPTEIVGTYINEICNDTATTESETTISQTKSTNKMFNKTNENNESFGETYDGIKNMLTNDIDTKSNTNMDTVTDLGKDGNVTMVAKNDTFKINVDTLYSSDIQRQTVPVTSSMHEVIRNTTLTNAKASVISIGADLALLQPIPVIPADIHLATKDLAKAMPPKQRPSEANPATNANINSRSRLNRKSFEFITYVNEHRNIRPSFRFFNPNNLQPETSQSQLNYKHSETVAVNHIKEKQKVNTIWKGMGIIGADNRIRKRGRVSSVYDQTLLDINRGIHRDGSSQSHYPNNLISLMINIDTEHPLPRRENENLSNLQKGMVTDNYSNSQVNKLNTDNSWQINPKQELNALHINNIGLLDFGEKSDTTSQAKQNKNEMNNGIPLNIDGIHSFAIGVNNDQPPQNTVQHSEIYNSLNMISSNTIPSIQTVNKNVHDLIDDTNRSPPAIAVPLADYNVQQETIIQGGMNTVDQRDWRRERIHWSPVWQRDRIQWSPVYNIRSQIHTNRDKVMPTWNTASTGNLLLQAGERPMNMTQSELTLLDVNGSLNEETLLLNSTIALSENTGHTVIQPQIIRSSAIGSTIMPESSTTTGHGQATNKIENNVNVFTKETSMNWQDNHNRDQNHVRTIDMSRIITPISKQRPSNPYADTTLDMTYMNNAGQTVIHPTKEEEINIIDPLSRYIRTNAKAMKASTIHNAHGQQIATDTRTVTGLTGKHAIPNAIFQHDTSSGNGNAKQKNMVFHVLHNNGIRGETKVRGKNWDNIPSLGFSSVSKVSNLPASTQLTDVTNMLDAGVSAPTPRSRFSAVTPNIHSGVANILASPITLKPFKTNEHMQVLNNAETTRLNYLPPNGLSESNFKLVNQNQINGIANIRPLFPETNDNNKLHTAITKDTNRFSTALARSRDKAVLARSQIPSKVHISGNNGKSQNTMGKWIHTGSGELSNADINAIINQDNQYPDLGSTYISSTDNTLLEEPLFHLRRQLRNLFTLQSKWPRMVCPEGQRFQCQAVGEYLHTPGMAWWCIKECKYGNCPSSKCKCTCDSKQIYIPENRTTTVRPEPPLGTKETANDKTVDSKQGGITRSNRSPRVIKLKLNGPVLDVRVEKNDISK